MNCKPDELAFVVNSSAGNEGTLVKCLRLATAKELHASSFVSTRGPVWVIDQVIPWTYGACGNLALDGSLRPIRPEADPVTTDCDVGVEA